jgi:hypothetical protein
MPRTRRSPTKRKLVGARQGLLGHLPQAGHTGKSTKRSVLAVLLVCSQCML